MARTRLDYAEEAQAISLHFMELPSPQEAFPTEGDKLALQQVHAYLSKCLFTLATSDQHGPSWLELLIAAMHEGVKFQAPILASTKGTLARARNTVKETCRTF